MIGYCTGGVQRVGASQKKTRYYSRSPELILPSLSGMVSSKPIFKNVIIMKLGRLKGHDKKFEIPYKMIITFKFKMQFLMKE